MVIYGVHRFGWGHVGEIELLTALPVNAEDFAKAQSADWTSGQVVVTSRELDKPGTLRLISVWKDGELVRHFGGNGEWRRVRASPF